jgi:hypothetical protein
MLEGKAREMGLGGLSKLGIAPIFVRSTHIT